MESAQPGAVPGLLAAQYSVVREIGRGGMAVVYLAQDRKHDREVAIKVLRSDLSAAIGIERFAREIRVVARLQHPHILPLYDSGDADGLLYFVMPYVDGESLRQRLTKVGVLPVEQAVRIIRQLADALDYAHARGVVHRDLKPENVLLSGDQALLCDFGVARAAAFADTGQTLTAVGMTMGTPQYMSPEQATGEGELDARSDVYALGCVCYELLSGAPPFTRGTATAVIGAHLTQTPAFLTSLVATLPRGVATAVARALFKDPDDRFSSAGAFASALEQSVIEASIPTTAVETERAELHTADPRKTVLVLDFANISGSEEASWLSSGIAETVSVDLQRIRAIRVVGSDAATRRRLDSSRDAGPLDVGRAVELGRSVGARWVVWGAFQKNGERVRLTPRFADTEDGTATSADKIDGLMSDIFALQDRIVTALTDLLRIQLSTDERVQIERPETTDLSAYEYYAKGSRAFQLFGMNSSKEADDAFRKAIAIDPNYALAHAGLGSLLMPKYIAFGRKDDLDEGVASLQRAIELDPAYGEPYVYLAYMYLRQDRFDDAIAAAAEAIDREPGAYFGYYLLGITSAAKALTTGALGELPKAIRPLLRSRALNPYFHPAQMGLGEIYVVRGEYRWAVPMIDEAVERERSGSGFIFLGSYVQRAFVHLNSGELELARPLLEAACSRYPTIDHVYAQTMAAAAYFVSGCLAERTGALDEAMAAFRAGAELAESHDHRLGIGAHWVKCQSGIARTLFRQGNASAASSTLSAARSLFRTRSRFVWGWILTASDCGVHYEIAAALAVLGLDAEAISELWEAKRLGWSDSKQLAEDPAFDHLRTSDEVRRLALEAGQAAFLAAPVGVGGMP